MDPVILTNVEPCTRIHRPSFTKTSRKCSFSVIENAHFGLVFTKTGSINLGTGVPVVARVSAAGVAVPILLLMSLLLPVFRTFLDSLLLGVLLASPLLLSSCMLCCSSHSTNKSNILTFSLWNYEFARLIFLLSDP